MNIALIFAGGTGQRMNSVSIPKQFLKVHNKPIIVHTIEKFQKASCIDSIIVVSLSSYIDEMYKLKEEYGLSKVHSIIPGGDTGQLSIYNGLIEAKKISKTDEDIVLIHDGVRPMIDETTILNNIDCVKKNGNAITISKAIETMVVVDDNGTVENVLNRNYCSMARAPQSFYLKDIYSAHVQALSNGISNFIDSAMLMKKYGAKLHTVLGRVNNIKITTPMDFFMFKAILDANETEQIKVL